MDNKLPKLNLSPEELALILKDVKVEIEPILPQRPYYYCDLCRDTKRIPVCGGPDQHCPNCAARF